LCYTGTYTGAYTGTYSVAYTDAYTGTYSVAYTDAYTDTNLFCGLFRRQMPTAQRRKEIGQGKSSISGIPNGSWHDDNPRRL
jgi:hypothetical protein